MMYHYGYGPDWGMGGYGSFGVLEFAWHVLVAIFVVALIVWAVRTFVGGGRHGRRMHGLWHAHSALEILNERFAKGEIDQAEYEERKMALLG